MRRLAPAIAVSILVALMGSTATVSQAAVDWAPLLPEGSLTEEVEPGVHRVISDGVRDLTRPVLAPTDESGRIHGIAAAEEAFASRVAAGSDGSVWLLMEDRFFRLGDERTYAWEVPGERTDQTPTRLSVVGGTTDAFGQNQVAVTEDGQLWVSHDYGSLLRFDGDEWTMVEPRLKGFRTVGTRVAPNGTVWALGENKRDGKKKRYALSRLDQEGWTRVELPPGKPDRRHVGPDYWGVTEESELWAVRKGRVSRYVDGSWAQEGRTRGNAYGLVTGPDGQLWETFDSLARMMDDEWEVFETDFTFGHTFGYPGAPWSPVSVDPAGRVWFAASANRQAEDRDAFLALPNAGCRGLAVFDGRDVRHFLDDMCIYDMDIARDGRVWVQAGSWSGDRVHPDAVGRVETYVITPEAVAGTE